MLLNQCLVVGFLRGKILKAFFALFPWMGVLEAPLQFIQGCRQEVIDNLSLRPLRKHFTKRGDFGGHVYGEPDKQPAALTMLSGRKNVSHKKIIICFGYLTI